MKTSDFEKEIQKLDEGFSIIPNPNRQGLANIYYRGANYDLPAVSSYEIKEKPDPNYTYEFPNGIRARLWSQEEIIPRLEAFLKNFEANKENYA
ncbi:MAG: hypothetical protein EBR82_14420 [Caulobacteraceae bacterium]|nr:hypothetical protein [Caulobacteraceae bacterium]